MRTLIFANGDLVPGVWFHRALSKAGRIYWIAADGGLRFIRQLEKTPDLIIGDMDSVDPRALRQFEMLGINVQRYPPEKDETDLELALKWAAAHNYTDIQVMGAIGGRVDQTLANMYLLALPDLQGCKVRFLHGDESVFLLRSGRHRLRGTPGDTLSLLPLKGDVAHVRTEGLYYPLNGETLHFGPARGVSNVFTENEAVVRFDDGLLLVTHTIGTPA